jgi:hypothetical protein
MELGDIDVAYNLAIEGLLKVSQAKMQVYARSFTIRTIARIYTLRTQGYIYIVQVKTGS